MRDREKIERERGGEVMTYRCSAGYFLVFKSALIVPVTTWKKINAICLKAVCTLHKQNDDIRNKWYLIGRLTPYDKSINLSKEAFSITGFILA